MIIAIDFDGTIVDHQYPDIGQPVPGAIEGIKEIYARNHQIMIWTMRSGYPLFDVKEYLKNNLDQKIIDSMWFNENPQQSEWTYSKKQYANFYIDDAAIGCPLMEYPSALSKRECVDWAKVMEILRAKPGF